jgi:hypothetical protein
MTSEERMSERDSAGHAITATVTGDVSGQMAIGANIQQVRSEGAPVTAEGRELLADFRRAVEELRAEIDAGVPAELAGPAQERVDELETAVAAAAEGKAEMDVTTFEYVRRWLGKNLPAVAGAVTSVVVHPLVGKLVEAAGDAAAGAVRRRLE